MNFLKRNFFKMMYGAKHAVYYDDDGNTVNPKIQTGNYCVQKDIYDNPQSVLIKSPDETAQYFRLYFTVADGAKDKFLYFRDSAGNVVGLSATSYVTIRGRMTVEAVYKGMAGDPNQDAYACITWIGGYVNDAGKYVQMCCCHRAVSDAVEMVEAGCVFTTNGTTGKDESAFVIGGYKVSKKATTSTTKNDDFIQNNTTGNANLRVYYRSYVTYKKDGENVTIYSNIRNVTYNEINEKL